MRQVTTRHVVALSIAAMLVAANPARGEPIVFDQPYLNNGDRGPFSEADANRQQAADDFVLTRDAEVTGVHWVGSYHSIGDPWAYGTPVRFVVRFFDMLGGMPAAVPFHEVVVDAVALDSGLPVTEGRVMYHFEADGFAPVPLAAGVPYAISVLEADVRTPSAQFRWANASSTVSTASFYRGGDLGLWRTDAGSRAHHAFTLLSNPPDCNENDVPDDLDIAAGVSRDCDGNGVPDECENDADADGVIDDCDVCLDTFDPDQLDTDGDGTGDACDVCPFDPFDDDDGDGVCGDVDACPDSDLSPIVWFDGFDTGLANDVSADGCSTNDLLAAAEAGTLDADQAAHLTNDLLRAGVITGKQKGAITGNKGGDK